MNAYWSIKEVHGVFVDAILTDEADHLVFCSFWGHDTAIRELQGRLTLSTAEGGLTAFNIQGDNDRRYVRVGVIDDLVQMTGRVHTDILGELVHLWLYRRDTVDADQANHRAMLISRSDSHHNLWRAVMQISPVPLLEHWETRLLPIMRNAGMIKTLRGVNQHGIEIVIDEDRMALLVRQECRDGHLTL